MRLINVSSRLLEEFEENNIPEYAILSHRWDPQEITFQQFQDGKCEKLPGYDKIEGLCKKAAYHQFKYAWMDTCCIDKKSSAELSEAINSMFQWYQKAVVCYVYLADYDHKSGRSWGESQWFTRGWTLQELLAPGEIKFYDKSWTYFGRKQDLKRDIQKITGINDIDRWREASIAKKMYWASKRETTRLEDQAYCLLGIFDINMPALYGEGKNAFLRLQREIIAVSDDETIFAWKDAAALGGGLLAHSAQAFRHSGSITVKHFEKSSIWNPEIPREPYSMTNKGLHLNIPLVAIFDPFSCSSKDDRDTYLAPLQCSDSGDAGMRSDDFISIYFRRMQGAQFARIRPNVINCISITGLHDPKAKRVKSSLPNWHINPRISSIFIRQRTLDNAPFSGPYTILVNTTVLAANGFTVNSKYAKKAEQMKTSSWTTVESGAQFHVGMVTSTRIKAGMRFEKRTTRESMVMYITIEDHRVSFYIKGQIQGCFFKGKYTEDGDLERGFEEYTKDGFFEPVITKVEKHPEQKADPLLLVQKYKFEVEFRLLEK